MDRRLYLATVNNDIKTIQDLLNNNSIILDKVIPGTGNTVLHLIARLGYIELAAEVVARQPGMISVENEKLETPMYEACKEGHVELVKMFLDLDPSVVYKTNAESESGLLAACKKGRVDVVKHLLKFQPRLLSMEMDRTTTSLHVAASQGFIGKQEKSSPFNIQAYLIVFSKMKSAVLDNNDVSASLHMILL